MDNRVGDGTQGRKVKKENTDEDFKEYAETTMNELLGWYGYGTAKEDMKTSVNCHSNSNSNSSGPPSPSHGNEGCGWCGKPVEDKTGISAGALSFCSELCFSQSRRANFKKNKTCDWCRHVRHTVSYVDFQDGASQLQFCSDKCLNQYKMHIFCRETRAHLELHPHLPNDDNGSGLITPDLWLKNCKSPDRNSLSPPISPKPPSSRDMLPQTSPLPLITVAHPSKLLAPSSLEENNKRKRTPVQRKRKQPSTVTCTNSFQKSIDLPQDLRIRQSPPIIVYDHPQLRETPRPNFQDIRVPPPQLNHNHHNFHNVPRPTSQTAKSNVQSILPPVTILVPYPILVPVPLPIPIPLPIQSFLDAEKSRNTETKEISSHREENTTHSNVNGNATSTEIDKTVENGTKANSTTEDVTNEEDPSNGISRPLRKRKRILESGGSKIVLKSSKKPLST